jgi:AAA family ATP:ADP antiporter
VESLRGHKGAVTWLLGLITEVRPGEPRSLLALFFTLFLLMFCSSLLKPVREILILTEGDPVLRSYSVAIQAVVLLFVIPIYGRLSQQLDKLALTYVIFTMLAFNLIAFAMLYARGVPIGIAFFVWLGIFGVLAGAHFWALVSELYSKESGERLFAVIALGASTGAWLGSLAARELTQFATIGDIFLLITAILLGVLIPITYAVNNVPDTSRPLEAHYEAVQKRPSMMNAFNLIRGSRYLMALAGFAFFYNWLNSTGEFLLANIAELFYNEGIANGETVTKEAFLGNFYGTFYLYVNIGGFLVQALLVSRIIKYLGVKTAIMITPLIVFVGYGVLSVFTIIPVFLWFKVTENSLDYSLQSTSRQILYLPLTREEKYEARSVIDTLVWRMGDLVQGFAVFIVVGLLELKLRNFVYLNVVLGLTVFMLARYIGRRYTEMALEMEKSGDHTQIHSS